MNRPLLLALAISLCSPFTVRAEDAPAPSAPAVAPVSEVAAPAATADVLAPIQTRWAEIKYQLPEDDRAEAFEKLAAEIAAQRTAHPEDVRLTVWEGIVLASQAGAQGGLGALSLCKQAKADFEAVIERDPATLDGSAYTSLGSLYYQVPGWPIGFGDEDQALAMLKKGLELNPDGIDSNFFYADFLLDQGEYRDAVAAFEKALAAPPRPGRESADAGRRAEIEAGLKRARAKLS